MFRRYRRRSPKGPALLSCGTGGHVCDGRALARARRDRLRADAAVAAHGLR